MTLTCTILVLCAFVLGAIVGGCAVGYLHVLLARASDARRERE